MMNSTSNLKVKCLLESFRRYLLCSPLSFPVLVCLGWLPIPQSDAQRKLESDTLLEDRWLGLQVFYQEIFYCWCLFLPLSRFRCHGGLCTSGCRITLTVFQ